MTTRTPAYRDGFDDSLDGHPLPIDATGEYIAGWLAAQECKALLRVNASIGRVEGRA